MWVVSIPSLSVTTESNLMALVGIKSKLSFPSIDKPELVRLNVPLLPTKVPFKSEKSF